MALIYIIIIIYNINCIVYNNLWHYFFSVCYYLTKYLTFFTAFSSLPSVFASLTRDWTTNMCCFSMFILKLTFTLSLLSSMIAFHMSTVFSLNGTTWSPNRRSERCIPNSVFLMVNVGWIKSGESISRRLLSWQLLMLRVTDWMYN